MIVVDTNVVSEAVRRTPDAGVERWFMLRADEQLHVTSTVVAELLFGVKIMPEGRRQVALEERIEAILSDLFRHRVALFDEEAARAYSAIRAAKRRSGQPISMGDAQIAAVCLVRDATLATRNTRDFEGCGIGLVNPWEE